MTEPDFPYLTSIWTPVKTSSASRQDRKRQGRHQITYGANGNIECCGKQGRKYRIFRPGLNRLVRENNELLNKTITYYYDEGGIPSRRAQE